MNLKQWESYKLRVLAKATGANVHNVTGVLYSLRDIITLKTKSKNEEFLGKVDAQIEKTIKYINQMVN